MGRVARSVLPAVAASWLSSCEAREPKEGGWIELFDGRSLQGWVTRGGRYDGDARWTVEDGAITGRQGLAREGGLLYTEREYADFELELDVAVEYPFDSGVFVRMVPDERGAQVTIDHRPGGEIGGIYSDGWLLHCAHGAERFRRGGWNHFRVECRGADLALRAWLNGEPLVDFALPAGSEGYAPRGRIGLQVHGGEDVPLETAVRFRNVRVRELPVPAGPDLEAAGRGFLRLTHRGLLAGWRPLFSGRDLSGWEAVGGIEGVRASDGVLSWSEGDGWLRTIADYRDFELRLDFRCGELANSGVFLRAARSEANPAFSGCEVQILDDFNWERATGQALKPWQFTGSLYGSVPPGRRDALRPIGEWNTLEVRFQGTRLRTALNGLVLYEVDTLAVPGDPPFAERAPIGAIGLQRHGAAVSGVVTAVEFRNLFVRAL